jgi:hypothetical protein
MASMDCLATPLADGHVKSISPANLARLERIERIEQVARSHPRRACLERFIAEVYLRRYGARINHFAEQLIASQDEAGDWLAAAGYTPATDAPLFVEQYLNVPVEDALTARIGAPVARHQVVEAGNLAAIGHGAARNMIVSLSVLLHRLQLGWVVLTGTRTLRNAFFRLGLAPLALVHASPQRLPDCGSSWGSYYQTDPIVLAADIKAGFFLLQARHRLDVRL